MLELLASQGWFDDGNVARAPEGPPLHPSATSAERGQEARFGKDTAQTHIVLATDTVPFADRRKYPLMVLTNLLGGGMSSRLFQRIRAELGLAYAIYSFSPSYRRLGAARTYGGTQPLRAVAAEAATP